MQGGGVEICLSRGPLSEREIAAIAALYGRRDSRYSEPSFLRRQFALPSLPPSFHVWARDGETVVGHCAIIPVEARTQAGRVVSGKAEAFYILESHRKSAVSGSSSSMFLAVQMLRTLYDAALNEALDPVHAIATPDIGVLHRLSGCAHVRIEERRFRFSPDAGALSKAVRRAYLRPAVDISAKLLGGAYAALARLTRALPREHSEFQVLDADLDGFQWGVDSEALARRHAEAGKLRVVAVGARDIAGLLAVSKATDSAQIVDWRATHRTVESALQLLIACLEWSRRNRLALEMRMVDGDVRSHALYCAARLLGFPTRKGSVDVYVCTRNPLIKAHPSPLPSPFLYVGF